MSDLLFTSALGVVTDSMVVTFDDDKRKDYHEKLLPGALHRLTLQRTEVPYVKPEPEGLAGPIIFVETQCGIKTAYTFTAEETIGQLKERIHDRAGIPPDQQRLLSANHSPRLADDMTLSEYDIEQDSTLYLYLEQTGGGGGMLQYYMSEDFRDKRYDYDFTHISDKKKFIRGDHEYKRPCGWIRMAVNVKGYGDTSWLGTARTNKMKSVPGEWPVSYHGTGDHEAKSIAEHGYDVSKANRFKFGAGIYSTPDISVAALYAKRFTLNGKQYKVVVQNRVNPEAVKKIPNQKTGVGEYWLTEREEDTRAYGICIRKVR